MSAPENLPAPRRTTEVGFHDRMPGGGAAVKAPPTRVTGLVTWLVLAGVGLCGGLVTWSAVAQIRGAVVATGMFEVEGDVQAVQHLEGGIVREIRVKEGDVVAKGDIIATLDDTRSKAQTAILVNQLVGALAREARLAAESRNATDMTLSAEAQAVVEANPSFRPIVEAQVALFRSNRQIDEGQVAILRERIGQIRGQIAGFEERRAVIQAQLDLVRDELEDMQSLFDQGLSTKARLIQRREDENVLIGDLQLAERDRQEAQMQIAEIEQRILQVRRDRQQAIADEMQAVKELIYDLRQRIDAARDVNDRLAVRAPSGGTVIDLALNTPGAVIAPGSTLMRIVPQDLPIVITARVRPADIDDVREGGEARVRLLAYSYRKTPPLFGTVVHVSADTLTDQATNSSYYEVNVRVPPEELAKLPDVKALPGMPVQVYITTGEQTVMAYLLDPVLGSLETALLETE